MFWRKRKIANNLKSVTEIAGDQIIAPGAVTLLLALGSIALAGAATYMVARNRKSRAIEKAARGGVDLK